VLELTIQFDETLARMNDRVSRAEKTAEQAAAAVNQQAVMLAKLQTASNQQAEWAKRRTDRHQTKKQKRKIAKDKKDKKGQER